MAFKIKNKKVAVGKLPIAYYRPIRRIEFYDTVGRKVAISDMKVGRNKVYGVIPYTADKKPILENIKIFDTKKEAVAYYDLLVGFKKDSKLWEWIFKRLTKQDRMLRGGSR